MTWEDLCDIYEDFHENKREKYDNILKDFTKKYLEDMNKGREDEKERIKVHSIHSRVKDPEHLIAKIIRKKQENQNKYSLEIQVRTLFEEGWGEVDHAVIYPYFQNDQVLKEYTELLNRLSGLADEMGGFFSRLKEMETGNNNSPLPGTHKKREAADGTKMTAPAFPASVPVRNQPVNTPNDCLQSVLNE